MGSKIMVVIEDQGTGKSLFLEEGDSIGDFKVVDIEEKEVVLKQEGGKEIILKSVKESKPVKAEEKTGRAGIFGQIGLIERVTRYEPIQVHYVRLEVITDYTGQPHRLF